MSSTTNDASSSRRKLNFESMDEISRDAEMLHQGGYTAVGQWNLSQACGHIASWMRYPMDGFPVLPIYLRPVFWVMKHTMGKGMLKKIIESNSMKEKAPTISSTVPKPDEDEGQAVQLLVDTVNRFKAWEDDFYPSPLFGDMDRETLTKLQWIHSAHHLSFLIPNGNEHEKKEAE